MKLEFTQPFARYFEMAEASTQAAMASHKDAVEILEKIHSLYETELSSIINDWRPSQALLIFSSEMTWLSSIRVATTGHRASTFPLFRASLEAVCYGYSIWAKPDLEQVWLDRHKNEESRRKSRKAFTPAVKDTAKHLVGRSFVWPGTEEWIKIAYEQSIDFGAHPNPKSILQSLSIDEEREDDMIGLKLAGVFGGDSFEAEQLLVACIDYGQIISLIAACSTDEPDQRIFESLNVINERKETYAANRFSQAE